MKKSLLLGIVSLAVGVASSYGQGFVVLDNYNFPGGLITYGANVPQNGVSGAFGSNGTGILGGWTVGLYWSLSTGLSDSAGNALPGAGLSLGVGNAANGATVPDAFSSTAVAGQFFAGNPFNVPGSASGQTVSLEVIAYDSAAASYASAAFRGHSAVFTIVTQSGTAPIPTANVGPLFTTFSVTPVPEPTTIALAGLGALSLLAFRRRK